MGRPKGAVVEGLRLAPVADRLTQLLGGYKVLTASDCVGGEVRSATSSMGDGDVLLLDNLRFHAEETANDPAFVQQLCKDTSAQVYVNEAFGAAHRAHASTAGVAQAINGPAVAGFLMEKELKYLYGAVDSPQRPLAAIVGGAKVSSKIAVLETLVQKVDKLLVGGGMAFTFYRAQGLSTGSSLVEEDKISMAEGILKAAQDAGVEVILPSDAVVAAEFAADAAHHTVAASAIPDGYMGLDMGPQSVAEFGAALSDCRTVIWNGPMGVFEFPAFSEGTFAVANMLAGLTDKGAVTIVGGGDSVAAVVQAGVSDKISHISTGGGASLELLEGKLLPGVEALDDKL